MKNKFDFKWYFLRWLTGVGQLIDGLLVTLTLGAIYDLPDFFTKFWDFDLKTQSWFLDYTEKIEFEKSQKEHELITLPKI